MGVELKKSLGVSMSNFGDKCESIEAARVREKMSDWFSEVGSEWHRLGGVLIVAVVAMDAVAAACAWAETWAC